MRLLCICVYWILVCVMFRRTIATLSLVKRNAFSKTMEFQSGDRIRAPQSLQIILSSINDKMHDLHTLELKLEYSLMQMTRRLDSIEQKMGRLENKVDVKMESFDVVVTGREVKEFSNENLFRRLDTLNEKLNDKASYLDVKLDTKLERITNKIDRLDRTVHSSMNDILERFVKSNDRLSTLENEFSKENDKYTTRSRELRALMNEDFNGLLVSKSNDFKSQLQELYFKLYDSNSKILTACHSVNDSVVNLLQESKANTDAVSDSSKQRQKSSGDLSSSNVQTMTSNITRSFATYQKTNDERFEELSSDLMLNSRKIVNVIQEHQKATNHLKWNLSSVLDLQNEVRDYMRLEFSRLREQIEPLPRLGRKFSHLNDNLNEKFQAIQDAIGSNLQLIFLAQNEFSSSCRRIQENEVQGYNIMQQVVHEMLNRSGDDIFEIYNRLGEQSTVFEVSLARLLSVVTDVGNVTARIEDEMKRKDQCIFSADDVNWNVIGSLCQRVSMEMPSSTAELVDLIRSVRLMDHKFADDWHHARPAQDSDLDERIASAKDYDLDYASLDYAEPISD